MNDFAIELPADDQIDEPHAEAELARPPRRRAVLLEPVERQGHAALRAADRPAQFELPLLARQAAVLDGIGGKLVQGCAQMKHRIGIEIEVRPFEGHPIDIRPQHHIEQLHDRD